MASMLSQTPKHWWIAEKTHICSWGEFKIAFQRDFLIEGPEVEGQQRMESR